MTDQRIQTAAADPRAWKRAMLSAAARGPTAVEETTDMLHVLRYREIERLLHEPRLRGVGLSLFDRMSAPVETRPAPAIGQHTDEVLADLGYDAAARAALRDRGAIR